jgi:hypothetical protein
LETGATFSGATLFGWWNRHYIAIRHPFHRLETGATLAGLAYEDVAFAVVEELLFGAVEGSFVFGPETPDGFELGLVVGDGGFVVGGRIGG